MSHTENIGSGWDYMLAAIINSFKIKNKCFYDGCHELEAMEKVLSVPEIGQLTLDWMTLLTEKNNVSLETSNEFRSIGNELYKNVNENAMKCVNFYTRAIFAAPTDSAELGMAYANRAAVLMNLGYYKEAHSDCKLAKLSNYPELMLLKVLWRQACCSIALEDLNQFTSDQVEIQELVDKLKIRHLHADKIEKLSTEYDKLLQKFNAKPVDDTACRSDLEKTLIEKQSLSKGRFMTAAEQISIDEVIMKEKAFAFVPVAQKFDQNPIDFHCQNCAATNIIPSPCVTCKRASYCGPSCLSEHKPIHQFECNGYKKHLWFEIGIAHLALRTMLCGINELLERMQQLHDATPLCAWNELLLLSVDDIDFKYGSVLQLVTNFDKTNSDDFMGYVLTATMITMYLKNYTEFFQKLSNKFPKFMSPSSLEIFIGAIITRHIGQLICNGHAISDFEITNFGLLTSANCIAKGKLSMSVESQRIFTAIFPRISVFNHSCDPNIRNRFNKTELVIYARRSINAGEEIFNCYGPNSRLNYHRERQEMLNQQYHFECDCLSCKGTDDDYLDSHKYLCSCGADVVVFSLQKFWWRDCADGNPPEKVLCWKCSCELKFEWLVEFRYAMEQLDSAFDNMGSADAIENAVLRAVAKYEQSSKYMKGDKNSQKLDMANMIIKYIIQYLTIFSDEPEFRLNKCVLENFDKFRNICRTSLNGTEYRFGRCSLENVFALAALMDIHAIFERSEDSIIQLSDFECLSDRTKTIFTNYFEKYVQNRQQ